MTDDCRKRLISYYEEEDLDEYRIYLAKTAPLKEVIDMICIDARNYRIMGDAASQDAGRAIARAEKAEGDLASAKQPLEPEMLRLNKALIAANEEAMHRAMELMQAKKMLADCRRMLDCVVVKQEGLQLYDEIDRLKKLLIEALK